MIYTYSHALSVPDPLPTYSSPYAGFFDINWSSTVGHLKGKVLLPLLGDHYGNVLERGEIVMRFDREHGSFSAWRQEQHTSELQSLMRNSDDFLRLKKKNKSAQFTYQICTSRPVDWN